jgi:hypothetical protein
MIAETERHAGHADIVRELIDGAIGQRPDSRNLDTEFDWTAHRARLETAARDAGGSTPQSTRANWGSIANGSGPAGMSSR